MQEPKEYVMRDASASLLTFMSETPTIIFT